MTGNFEMKISTTLDTFLCGCGQEFAIVMVMRPSDSYANECPESEPTWMYWSAAAATPFCPHCGEKVGANAELKGGGE